jgi:hypothetical protein
MSDDELQNALAMLEYAATRRSMYLTVHALSKVRKFSSGNW